MYEQPKKNAEDFLLGKAVKSLEELAEISRDEAEETPAQRLARLDMQAKFREDPLNLMRQHELDKRNALLQNTAKMKKLQRLIEKQKRQQKKRDHRRNRKKKSKHSARHHHRESNDDSCSSSSSDSEDDAILDKFISLIQQQEPGVDSSGLDSLQRHVEKKKEEKPSKKKKKSKEHVTKKKHKHKHHDREKHSHNRSQSPKVKEEEEKKKILRPDPPARRSSPPPIHGLPPSTTKRRPSPAPRRSREEMAALRAQMAADAKERERERVERYQRHQTEAKQQEASELASRNTHGASFLKGLTLAHVATSSVEEGVQRKASSRQRGGMEENFLRH
ncbi:hypothetical protein AAHC03_01801 [Spirometra sp. Aus1]